MSKIAGIPNYEEPVDVQTYWSSDEGVEKMVFIWEIGGRRKQRNWPDDLTAEEARHFLDMSTGLRAHYLQWLQHLRAKLKTI